MRCRILICLYLLLIFLTPHPAHGDSQMGIYFDETGTVSQVASQEANTLLQAYLILTDPQVTGPITDWECTISVLGGGYIMPWELMGNAIRGGVDGEYLVHLAEPMPPAALTILAQAQILTPGPAEPMWLYIHPASEPSVSIPVTIDNPIGYPVFQPAVAFSGVWQSVDIASGYESDPVAVINNNQQAPEVQYILGNDAIILGGYVGAGELVVSNAGTVPFSGSLALLSGDLVFRYENFPASRSLLNFRLEPEDNLIVAVTEVSYYSGSAGELLLDICGNSVTIPVIRQPVLTTTTDTLDCGTWALGYPTGIKTFIIENTGSDYLRSVNAIVPPTAQFVVTPVSELSTIGPGEQEAFEVEFLSTETGQYSAWVEFAIFSDPILLLGNCMEQVPDIQISATEIVFPDTYIGSSPSMTFTLTIQGDISYIGNYILSGEAFNVDGSGEVSLDPHDASRQSLTITTTFAPEAAGNFQGTVIFDPPLESPIQLTGYCPGEPPSITFSPRELHFGYVLAGEPATRTVTLHNEGSGPISGHLVADPDYQFGVTEDTAEFVIPAGASHEAVVTFSGQEGPWSSRLFFPETEDALEVSALCRTSRNTANIGVFFDSDEFVTNQIQAATGDTVTAYVVANLPNDFFGLSWGQWQACVEIVGNNELLSWNLESSYWNFLAPPCFWSSFSVDDDETQSVLASAKILINCDDCMTEIRLNPTEYSSIAGYPIFVLYANSSRFPIIAPTFTGEPLVATINSTAVGLSLPRPAAMIQGSSVNLSWNVGSSIDACHVYRRIGDMTVVRLTDSPVPVINGKVEFFDTPSLTQGVPVYYSYSALTSGREVGLSPETEVQLDFNPLPTVTVFKGNYPNPFNPQTTFSFDLAEAGTVRLEIFDLSGRRICRVVDKTMVRGSHEAVWPGRNDAGLAVSSGVYFARLQVGAEVMMRKIALLK